MLLARNLLLTILALGLVVGLQAGYDKSAGGFVHEETIRYVTVAQPLVPTEPVLKALSLGDGPLVADLLWLDTIQYFGGGDPYGTYKALGGMLDRITALDPQYEYPYEFALIVLPYMNQAHEAIVIGQRAQQSIPNDGLLTYYLATDYQLNLHDYKDAAKYYELAAKQPGAPGAAITLAATSLDHITGTLADRLAAAEFWKTAYERETNPDLKKQDYNWYLQLEQVYNLEDAAQSYKQKNGTYPANFQDMVSAGFIPSIPVSPVDRQLILDPSTGKVSFDSLANQS
jgi:hypothetical protein